MSRIILLIFCSLGFMNTVFAANDIALFQIEKKGEKAVAEAATRWFINNGSVPSDTTKSGLLIAWPTADCSGTGTVFQVPNGPALTVKLGDHVFANATAMFNVLLIALGTTSPTTIHSLTFAPWRTKENTDVIFAGQAFCFPVTCSAGKCTTLHSEVLTFLI